MADWALILGSSSGFGEACARAFAADGLNVYGVHLDRKSTLAHVEEVVDAIRAAGRDVEFFNVNAADPAKREEIVRHVKERLGNGGDQVRVLLHSLAFGTLKPYIGKEGQAGLSQRELEMTLDVMANSLLYWARDAARNHRERDPRRRDRHARAAEDPGLLRDGRGRAEAEPAPPPDDAGRRRAGARGAGEAGYRVDNGKRYRSGRRRRDRRLTSGENGPSSAFRSSHPPAT